MQRLQHLLASDGVIVSTERKPIAYRDLRNWIDALKAAGEIKEINAEVDWEIELGTIMRLAQGAGDGPALLFNNIKDYNQSNSRCRRIFGGAGLFISSRRRAERCTASSASGQGMGRFRGPDAVDGCLGSPG